MFKKLKKAIASFEERDKLEKEAWKAEQANRARTAEKLLVKLTMIKIRDEFVQKASEISEYLSLQTEDGEYENEQVTIQCLVQGKKVKDGWTAAGASFHSFLFEERSRVIDSEEAEKISAIAQEFGLSAGKYAFSNPTDAYTLGIEKRTQDANTGPKILLTLTRK